MSIKIGWYHEQDVVIIQLEGENATKNYQRMGDILYDLYDNSPSEKIHAIIDASRITKVPNVATLTGMKLHPKRGWVLMLTTSNRIVAFIASIAAKIAKSEIKLVNNLNEVNKVLSRISANSINVTLVNDTKWLAEITDETA